MEVKIILGAWSNIMVLPSNMYVNSNFANNCIDEKCRTLTSIYIPFLRQGKVISRMKPLCQNNGEELK